MVDLLADESDSLLGEGDNGISAMNNSAMSNKVRLS